MDGGDRRRLTRGSTSAGASIPGFVSLISLRMTTIHLFSTTPCFVTHMRSEAPARIPLSTPVCSVSSACSCAGRAVSARPKLGSVCATSARARTGGVVPVLGLSWVGCLVSCAVGPGASRHRWGCRVQHVHQPLSTWVAGAGFVLVLSGVLPWWTGMAGMAAAGQQRQQCRTPACLVAMAVDDAPTDVRTHLTV